MAFTSPILTRLQQMIDSSSARFSPGFAGAGAPSGDPQTTGASPAMPPAYPTTTSRVYEPMNPREGRAPAPPEMGSPGSMRRLTSGGPFLPEAYVGDPGQNLAPFGGVSPYATATGRQFTDASGTESYPVLMGSPERPNINYTTPEWGQQAQRIFGGNLNVIEGTGPDPIDVPQQLLNFGGEEQIPVGQLAWMIARGDTPEQIQRYITNQW